MAHFLARYTGFAWFSRSWDTSEMYDLTGRVAIVTGGNTGLGYISCRELLKKGCKVYMASRSEDRAREAIARLHQEVPAATSNIIFLPFDLTDIASAQRAAQTIMEQEQRLDIILANAGIMAWPYKIINGIESQAWNHFGHASLIQPLLPLLKHTATLPDSHVRIVNVSSLGHRLAPKPDFSSIEAVNGELGGTWKRYGASKLYNILYTKALQKRLDAEGANIRVLTLHPGNIHTELIRGPLESYSFLGKPMQKISSKVMMTPEEGAKTQLYACASPEVDEKDLRGAYLFPVANVETTSGYGSNEKYADELYELSEKVIRELGPKL